ncbi:MAG TPA: 8-amino-7-oxononanoate synthase [Longimicrobiales bacterium]
MTFSALAAELAELEARGLRRTRRPLQSPQAPRVTVGGATYVAFCSNDYLGLASDPRLARAVQQAVETEGVGAGASHLVLGHSEAHGALEHALARFVGLPRALLFSTGYMANIGAITALAGREDAVFADRLNHASLNDACLLSRAQCRRYAHADVNALAALLERTRARRKLIVTDAVFSMDGDIAPVAALLELAERYDAWLYLDDAHGFGVLGAGRGVLTHLGVRSPRIIYMGTLGKAAGTFGAFVAGESALVEFLIQRARTYIYTTALPPVLSRATLKSLELIETEQWRRDHLMKLIHLLKQGTALRNWRLLDSDTAIQPLVIGDNAAAVAVSDRLAERGLLVPAIRPPTVPPGSARLRISLSAAHSEADVARLTESLNALARQ